MWTGHCAKIDVRKCELTHCEKIENVNWTLWRHKPKFENVNWTLWRHKPMFENVNWTLWKVRKCELDIVNGYASICTFAFSSKKKIAELKTSKESSKHQSIKGKHHSIDQSEASKQSITASKQSIKASKHQSTVQALRFEHRFLASQCPVHIFELFTMSSSHFRTFHNVQFTFSIFSQWTSSHFRTSIFAQCPVHIF